MSFLGYYKRCAKLMKRLAHVLGLGTGKQETNKYCHYDDFRNRDAIVREKNEFSY